MKKTVFYYFLFFIGLMTGVAQVPINEQLTYQSVVRNAQNQLVINQSAIEVTVTVWNADGTVKQYEETHTGLSTNANGLLTLMVGGGTVSLGTWNSIDWSAASIQTVISYDPGSGTVSITSDFAPVTAVPYATQAGNVTPQVQANWNESDDTQASFIRNKPDLSGYATQTQLNAFMTETNNTLTGINTNITSLQSQITSNDNDITALQANDVTINNRITTDSAALHNALKDTATAIRSDIGNGTLTIQTNGITTGTFTANQSTEGTINITVPTTVAELTDANDYATKTGNNTFSGTNDFSGTVTVPNAITDLATTLGSSCTQNAVNVCDLLALFDSLNRRIAYLEAVVSSVVDNITITTVATSQATNVSASKATVGGVLVSAGGSTVTERGFCYSTTNHEPTTDDTKQIIAGTSVGTYSYNFTELPQNTTYYVKAYVITSDNNTYYGHVVTFTTLIPTLGVVPNQTSPLVVCGEGDVVYTAEMESDDIANYTLAWYVDETVQDGQTSETFTVHSNATTSYTVKCVATRTGGSAEGSTTMNITVNPNPAVTLTRLEGNMGDDWGKVQISDAENLASASWKLNDVVLGTWTSGKTEVLPAGTYSVILTSNDGCEVTKPLTIRTSPVCVAQTAINSTLETTYELAGQQYVKTIKDHEGNEYNVLQIGTRCWTRENMRVVTSPTTGSTLITNGTAYQSKSAQWPYNDPATYTANKYGVMYNWCAALDVHHADYPEIAYSGEAASQVVLPHPTANQRGICPEGWHVPVNNDYVNLNSLFPKGGQWATGSDWDSGTAQGPGDMSYAERNISGFSALPAGSNPNLETGVPSYFHFTAWFVTATEYAATQNWRSPVVYLYSEQNSISGSWNTSWTGICQFNHQRISVRCIRNSE